VPLRGFADTIHKNIRQANNEMSPNVLIPWITTLPQALATLLNPILSRPASESRAVFRIDPIAFSIDPDFWQLERTLTDNQRLPDRLTFQAPPIQVIHQRPSRTQTDLLSFLLALCRN
jgi:hypothetical protein